MTTEAGEGCPSAPWPGHDVRYVYDLGGNRLSKTSHDLDSGQFVNKTVYHYDLENDEGYAALYDRDVIADAFESRHNRVMFSELFGAGGTGSVAQRTEYVYDDGANVRTIVTSFPSGQNPEHREALSLHYTKGKSLWFAVKEAWDVDDSDPENIVRDNFERLAATQYLADGVGIARHTVRSFTPSGSDSLMAWTAEAEQLRDFDGDEWHQDYSLSLDQEEEQVSTVSRIGFAGFGHEDGPSGARFYAFGNQVGTHQLSTNGAGDRQARSFYTAFGSRLFTDGSSSARPRFGYAGQFGYEEKDPPFAADFDVLADAGIVHVGARYYDPSLGRFLQRDPIGLAGGSNHFEYTHSEPTRMADSTGLDRFIVGTPGVGDHWGIAVDLGNGKYFQVDFACTGWVAGQGSGNCFGGPGTVTHSFPRGLGPVVRRYGPSPSEDAELIGWMVDQLLNPPEYDVFGNNCQHFAVDGAQVGVTPSWIHWIIATLPPLP